MDGGRIELPGNSALFQFHAAVRRLSTPSLPYSQIVRTFAQLCASLDEFIKVFAVVDDFFTIEPECKLTFLPRLIEHVPAKRGVKFGFLFAVPYFGIGVIYRLYFLAGHGCQDIRVIRVSSIRSLSLTARMMSWFFFKR